MKDKHPLVHVIWEDHASLDAWSTFDDIDITPALVHTVGWVIKETRTLLVVASNMRHNAERCFGITYIIKSCIRARQRVTSSLVKKVMKGT
jgi:hypothetical protein